VRLEILGCQVDNLTMDETLERIEAFVRSGKPHQHVVVNVDKIVKAARDPAIKRIINSCDLINADGMPVVWASRLLRKPLKERVTGIDLFLKLLERAEQQGWRVYLLGAKEPVLRAAVAKIRERFPRLNLVGYRNGYWSESEEPSVMEAVARARPHLLFVAISSPKKEELLARYRELVSVPFSMGIGGTLDVVAGEVSRAPVWMQDAGLEWFYRFLQEPRRMFKRYFVDDSYFYWLFAREFFKTLRPKA